MSNVFTMVQYQLFLYIESSSYNCTVRSKKKLERHRQENIVFWMDGKIMRKRLEDGMHCTCFMMLQLIPWMQDFCNANASQHGINMDANDSHIMLHMLHLKQVIALTHTC